MILVGSDDIMEMCRQPRNDVMQLVTPVVGRGYYGSTLEFIGIGVIFQDAGLMELGVRPARKTKEIGIDVEVSRKWVRNASAIEIRFALLQCIIKAVRIAKQRLTRKTDDFDADKLVADLEAIADKLNGKIK